MSTQQPANLPRLVVMIYRQYATRTVLGIGPADFAAAFLLSEQLVVLFKS
jgi:hypothetical protein